MNRKIPWKLLSLILFLSSSLVAAQTGNQRRVSTVYAVLIKAIESKNATVGQQVSLRTISDVMVDGAIVIPRKSSLLGHISEVITKGKDEPQSVLGLIIERAVTPDGIEVPLQAIVAAVASPQSTGLSSDPTYGMMHSNEPKMVASPGSSVTSGGLSSASKAGSTAAVATANLKGAMDEPSVLNEDSQGAVGYEGVSITWHLMAPPPVTVFSSSGKNVKLEAGTQMLLRMATPRLAR